MIINDLPHIMLICLICTIIIETTIGYLLGIKDKKDLIVIILVNIMTNPLVTSISTYFNVEYSQKARIISLIFLELFAFISEGYIYKKTLKYNKKNPYIISMILNICSYTLGLIIM